MSSLPDTVPPGESTRRTIALTDSSSAIRSSCWRANPDPPMIAPITSTIATRLGASLESECQRSSTCPDFWKYRELAPKLAILDETDSGLDIDALRIVAEGVNALKRPDNATIVVTHYQRLLNYIVPDFVHVLAGGKIVKSGGKDLALELEAKGYDWVLETA